MILVPPYDSSAPFEPEVRNWSCGTMRANFGFGAPAAVVGKKKRQLIAAAR
jgi:hypothetical protein